MPHFTRPFRCEVLTPQMSICDLQAVSVIIPTPEGQVGILAGRAPFVAMVGGDDDPGHGRRASGVFRRRRVRPDGENGLTILAEQCVAAAELDYEEVWDELDQARGMPLETPEDIERRREALDPARIKFALAQEQFARP